MQAIHEPFTIEGRDICFVASRNYHCKCSSSSRFPVTSYAGMSIAERRRDRKMLRVTNPGGGKRKNTREKAENLGENRSRYGQESESIMKNSLFMHELTQRYNRHNGYK